MTRSRWTPAVGLAVAVLLVGALLAAFGAGGAAAAPAGHRAAPTKVLHRVVWDQSLAGRHGVHLWAADHDGSHARKIYASHRGFITSLVLDRTGRRVAFSPCCRDDLPRLVVVPVDGGPVLQPLAHHPEFYFVGGIGWSPHGTRLAFEGAIDRHDHLTEALWTVRPDGSGLHRLLRLPDPTADDSTLNDALAWTRAGVLYCQGSGLRIARHGRSHLLIRDAYEVRITGDGKHILTERSNRATFRQSIWYGDADGTHQRRLWLGPRPSSSARFELREPVPDFHGRHLLTTREDVPAGSDDVVDWPVGAVPGHAPTLDFLSHSFAYAWN